MKALIYGGPGKITCEAVPDPELPDAQGAIVRTTLCAICGSDLHPYHIDTGVSGYCIGHEAVGEVVEVGRDVKRFKVGDRVLLPGSVGCGRCDRCLVGDVVFCRNAQGARVYGLGQPDLSGCQAQGVAVPVADMNLWRLPGDISDEAGILLSDNLATAWFGARRVRVGAGDTVAVIGLGSVGLQIVMAARAMRAERVLTIDLLASRRAHAARLGAEPVEAEDVVAAVAEMTGGKGVDVALDANGGPTTTPLAIKLIGRGGRVAVVGVSEHRTIPFPVLSGFHKNFEFHAGVCSIQRELPTLFEAIEGGRLDLAALQGIFTHRMPLSQGAEAYRRFDARPDGLLKIALDPAA